jgi:hypothetical protein
VIHLSKNIRQTTILRGFGPKRPRHRNPAKLASEYALYMILEARGNACKIGFPLPKTLTIRGSPPIRPRFLELDEILNPVPPI